MTTRMDIQGWVRTGATIVSLVVAVSVAWFGLKSDVHNNAKDLEIHAEKLADLKRSITGNSSNDRQLEGEVHIIQGDIRVIRNQLNFLVQQAGGQPQPYRPPQPRRR
jgi:hypothetical protein